MARRVQVILLCEDRQHEAFARRFLRERGWTAHQLRVEKVPHGEGSGEQYVRERYLKELVAFRRSAVRNRALVVLIDGDNKGVAGRMRDLDAVCEANNEPARRASERVFVFVPTWNIETWLAYLGGSAVCEGKRNYPRLAQPGRCQPHVDALVEMCNQRQLRDQPPPSLVSACEEYDRLASLL